MQVYAQDVYDLIKKKYLTVHKLVEGKRHDLRSVPIPILEEARDLLLEIISALTDLFGSRGDEINRNDIIILAGVLFTTGTVSMALMDETSAKDFMGRALALFKNDYTSPDYVFTALAILFQLGVLNTIQKQRDEAFKYFELVDSTYKTYKESGNQKLIDFSDLILKTETSQAELKKVFDGIHAMTLTYMAPEYAARNQEPQNIVFIHNTLKRQLSVDAPKIYWADTVTLLAEMISNNKAFRTARHHLAAAEYVLGLRCEELKKMLNDPMYDTWNTELNKSTADVNWGWIKYCKALLETSHALQKAEEEGNVAIKNKYKVPDELVGLHFDSFDVSSIEKSVTADWIRTWDDARLVFLRGQECVNAAKSYYTLSDFVSEYVTIIKDYASLYQEILFWEKDGTRKCKIIKKRIGVLIGANSVLSPHINLNLSRDIWYEIGEAYSTFIELKMGQLVSKGPRKISSALPQANEGLRYTDKFINSFKIPGMNKLPDTYPPAYELQILKSYFYSVQILMTKIVLDSANSNKWAQLALDHIKVVEDYSARHPDRLQDVGMLLVLRELKTVISTITNLATGPIESHAEITWKDLQRFQIPDLKDLMALNKQ